ncbi:hypothetical protein SAMN05444159_1709 [Bradyrhizobium lablabi]|uniref:Uncharacterized protein n=1 Tax=Bradyrhizobium lablabi TaxID=722472 RepID=A0A1M6MRC3_9BRAD|nr:hypothetical protein [Bradyrhizobium lablabi]SHJ85930.1 hypothetical protein SAMN05444159_1709 [Bradyrhizobium lablabi]
MTSKLLKTWLVMLVVNTAVCERGVTQDQIEGGQPAEGSQPEISRDEWRSKVEDARRRAEQQRREGINLIPPQVSETAIEAEMSRRAIEDESLQPGDIVSTNRGLFKFKGGPLENRGPDNFEPMITPRQQSNK